MPKESSNGPGDRPSVAPECWCHRPGRPWSSPLRRRCERSKSAPVLIRNRLAPGREQRLCLDLHPANRDKGVVDEVLDSSFSGVFSDFYAAYNHYPGLKQRCWAHLLRDIHDLKGLYPEDAGLAQWAEAVHQVYTRLGPSPSPARPSHPANAGGETNGLGAAFPSPGGSGQALPAHGTVHQGTVCLRVGPSRQTTTPPSGACGIW